MKNYKLILSFYPLNNDVNKLNMLTHQQRRTSSRTNVSQGNK